MQVSDELALHLRVSGQSEGVGHQGRGVQVVQGVPGVSGVHLAGHRFPQAAQALLHHEVLQHRDPHRSNKLTIIIIITIIGLKMKIKGYVVSLQQHLNR